MNEKEKRELEEAEKIGKKNREIILQYVKDGKLPAPRALTQKERKAMDAAGVNPFKIKRDDLRNVAMIREDCADWILENIFKDFTFPEDLPNNIYLWFGNYVFGMTYRDDLSEKN
jgi:hypothetical protein